MARLWTGFGFLQYFTTFKTKKSQGEIFEKTFKERINMFDTIFIYVPSMRQIVRISEGSGDNLLDEDIEAGYVDYIYYEQHSREIDFPEVDGGQIMLTELFQEKYKSTKECIPAVLDMAYGDANIEYIVLN